MEDIALACLPKDPGDEDESTDGDDDLQEQMKQVETKARSQTSQQILSTLDGRRVEALELTEKVVTARKRTLGEEHPETLRSMHKLAIRYSEVGRRQEAMELTEKVVTARKRTLGEEHPKTLRSMHNLAICYSEVG
jgi:alkylhydroperoxidase family enzyme